MEKNFSIGDITKLCFCADFLIKPKRRKYWKRQLRKRNTDILKNLNSIQKALYNCNNSDLQADIESYSKMVDMFENCLRDLQDIAKGLRTIENYYKEKRKNADNE